jgi:hypothetical protein
VLATKVNDTLTTTDGAEARADELIEQLPARSWRRLSVGAGAHGPREYDRARIPIGTGWRAGREHWLLARRWLSDPSEIAYYVCYGPRRSSLWIWPGSPGLGGGSRNASSRPRTKPGSITTRSGLPAGRTRLSFLNRAGAA